MIRIGIDIGGTFTDFTVWRGADEGYTSIHSFKIPSSPPKFADAVKEGLGRLVTDSVLGEGEDILVVHGTTVSTNTIIERSGPALALLTTAGFHDLLDLQRLRLENPMDLFSERPKSLIPRELVFPIRERIGPDGTILEPILLDDVVQAGRTAAATGVEGIVICFLHSYQNARHEEAARDALRQAGIETDIVLSSEVFAQQGEYERAVVAVLNAYVKRRMADYIGELQAFLSEHLPSATLLIMRSNGGVMSAEEARQLPVHTLLSGPSAGVTAARYLGTLLGADRILTMDMGGTSTDLSLVWNGRANVTTQALVGDFPLMLPVTGIEAIGAGGGSIASIDGTVIKVGPRSAGSRPGPACYGNGGTQPTLSDAYLLCGLLDSEMFLGGALPLHLDLAEKAMSPIADFLGADLETAAEACIAIGTSNMVAKVLPYLARLGVDPQDLTLLLYGGAGAVHGPLLAQEIGIERLIVPRTPSVFCAVGGIVSELIHDVVKNVRGTAMSIHALGQHYAELEQQAIDWLAHQIDPKYLAGSSIERFAEMRYRGQFFTVDVALPKSVLSTSDIRPAELHFHKEHDRIYGYRSSSAVEFISLRVRIDGRLEAPGATSLPQLSGGANSAITTNRSIRLSGQKFPETPIFDRARLSPGQSFAGPAIVEQSDATVVVPPGYSAWVGDYGDLILERTD